MVELIDRTYYNIKDTFTFVNNIHGFNLPQSYVLISLDVTSLFTNIPLDLIVDILYEKWDLIKDHTLLSKNSFITNTFYF